MLSMPCVRWAVGVLMAFPILATALETTSFASGAQSQITANLLLVQGQVSLPPTPHVAASGSTAYGPLSQQLATVTADLLGTRILSTGVVNVQTHYDTTVPRVTSTSRVDDAGVNLQLTPLVPLLGLQADTIQAHATIDGVCGNLTASGSSPLTNARVTGLGGALLNLPANPAPNTVVALAGITNVAGVSITLNEQTFSGDARHRTLDVNAVHIRLDVNVLGALNSNVLRLQGDIILGQAHAERTCAAGDGPNLVSSKTATPLPATVGQPLTFTLGATNQGNETAPDLTLTDALNPAFAFVSAQPTAGGSCVNASGVVTCSWPSVLAGSSVSATVKTTPLQAGTYPNALVAALTGPDEDPSDNTVSITVPVNPAPPPTVTADASVIKTLSVSNPVVNQPLPFVLTVRNSGPDASSVSVSDMLPSGLSYQSAVATSGGSCSGSSPVVCSWSNLPSGATVSATLTALATQAGTYTNTASVTVGSNATDPNSGNNTSTVVFTVTAPSNPQADGSIQQQPRPQPAPMGEPMTLELTAVNQGPQPATFAIRDVVPSSFSLTAITPSAGGSCSGTTTVQCSWPSVGIGSTVGAILTLVPNQQGSFSNTATLTVTGATDPDLTNNTTTQSIVVGPPLPGDVTADLGVSQNASPMSLPVGSQSVISVDVRNGGPDEALARLSMALDSNLKVLSVVPAAGGVCSMKKQGCFDPAGPGCAAERSVAY